MTAFFVVIDPLARAYVRAGRGFGYCYTLANARRFVSRSTANRFVESLNDGKSYTIRFISK